MRILFLTPRLPYPPYRGDKLKIFNLIKQLSCLGHEVHLLSFIAGREEVVYVSALKKYCASVHTVYLPVWRSLVNCLLALFSSVPFQVSYYRSRRMKSELDRLLQHDQFDILHIHLIRMAQYGRLSDKVSPSVLDLTDAGSLYLKRFATQSSGFLKKILLKSELARLSRYESILGHFPMSLVCSEVDRKVLLEHSPDAIIKLLYNGVDLDYFALKNSEAQPFHKNRIIYTGNMKYFPNQDGAIYFLEEIFPRVKKKVHEAKLFIVGKDPPKKLVSKASNDVVVTGFVQNLTEQYLQSAVAIAPIRFGAGTLNKVLEPLALGVPVVATSISVDGLPLQHGHELLVGDSPDSFADGIVRVLTDDSLRETLGANGRKLVRNLYGWDGIARQLEAYYKEIITLAGRAS